MRTTTLLTLALCVFANLPVSAAEHTLNGQKFTLQDGWGIELVAASPLVDRPITIDLDERGRLYVSDSSGSNDPVQKQLEERTHRIVRLEDTDGDGKYDKSVVFADKMMFPEGTLWYDRSLYVTAPPSIWKLTDTDGDGVADKREEWFAGKTLTGCANDLHGPYLGPDGWIYWCKGAFAEQTYEQPGKKPLVTKAAHIFRRRADGTGPIENVMTGGMDNPVDVVFTSGGERFFTTTFLQNPGGGLRDGMIHAVYGGVYGKVHNVTDFHPRTGDLLPPLVHMGAAAPCGLVRYESDDWGSFHDQEAVLACQFNMHKVSRHDVHRSGATFESVNSDFVVSDNIDFHPTDIIEDGDGSLIICDTGGWYKLCCPTSQLSKPDVLGAIYRVRQSGTKSRPDVYGTKINWGALSAADLAKLLDDPRRVVRNRAVHLLGRHKDAVAALTPLLRTTAKGGPLSDAEVTDVAAMKRLRKASDFSRLYAVWALTRVDSPDARAAVRTALFDTEVTVRQAALQSASLWQDRNAVPLVLKLLAVDVPQNQRLAAEVLGKLQIKSAVPVLLETVAARVSAREKDLDRMLEHGITYALIEIADPVATAKGLADPHPAVRRVAMIALDQMPEGKVDPAEVVALLSSREPILKETALWLTGRHPEWADSLAGYLRSELERLKPDADAAELVGLLARFAGSPSIQELLAAQLRPAGAASATIAAQLVSLSAMQKSGLKQLPDAWIGPLAQFISSSDDVLKVPAVAVTRSVPWPKSGTDELAKSLRAAATQQKSGAERRIEALAALPSPGKLDDSLFSLLVGNLGEEASVSTRSAAVDSLGRASLSVEQQGALADAIPKVGPLDLNRLLGVFETATDEGVGHRLIAGLKRSPVLTSLRTDMVKLRLAKFPAAVQQEAEELYAAINVEAGRQKQKLDEMIGSLPTGDIRRGQVVFQNSKVACSACHAIGYLGGNIGPDLSRIGKIRTERDLLEALLFPSVSFVRSYEPVLIVTKSGKSLSGLIRGETPDEIRLATGAKEEARIPRDEIDEIRPGTVSIMPAGLDTQLTKEQIADLVAFLKSRQ